LRLRGQCIKVLAGLHVERVEVKAHAGLWQGSLRHVLSHGTGHAAVEAVGKDRVFTRHHGGVELVERREVRLDRRWELLRGHG
jgi:hypothetical protein